jgi:hypothetical protein
MKQAMPDGSTHLLLTPQTLLRRLAALVPPPRQNLTRFHGVLAPNARLRPLVTYRPAQVEVTAAPEPPLDEAAASPAQPAGKSRVPWADLLKRSFGDDVLRCPCGGRRRILAHLVNANVVRHILKHLGLPFTPLPLASAQSPPQRAFWS